MERLSPAQTWLYDNLPIGVAILDRDLAYRYVNASFAATQGYTPAQLQDRPLSQGQPDWVELLTRMALETQETHRAGEEYDVTLTYPRQPTIKRTWDVTVLPVFNENLLDSYVVYLVDVTARRQAEQLATSEARLRSILTVAADAIIVIDQDGMILQVNPATSRIFGYTTEELIGKPVVTIMPAPYKDEHNLYLGRYQHTGIPHIIGTIREVEGRKKDGTVLPLELSVAESRESPGRRIFVGILRDITERKRLQAELEDARARVEAILDTVPLPLVVIDPDGRVTLFNEAAHELYGDIVVEGRLFEITRLRPDTRAPVPPEEWPVYRALREGRAVKDVEQILVFKDGTELPLLVHAAPVLVNNRVIAAVSVAQDLSQLKAADRAKDAFLALITHELRSPLTAIISWGELARDDASVRDEALDIILRSAHTQRRIIDDLLDISRVIYGKLSLHLEPVDAWEVTCRTAEGQRTAMEQRHLTLVLQPPGEPLPVQADPVRLTQIINNLLTNAMKFTPAGGTITVAGARDGAMARLQVRDTGYGIPPIQLPFIFQRFQQIGRERISGGLGLGLAVVKSLVELHNGHVEAESAGTDKGTTFTVWLPLRGGGGGG